MPNSAPGLALFVSSGDRVIAGDDIELAWVRVRVMVGARVRVRVGLSAGDETGLVLKTGATGTVKLGARAGVEPRVRIGLGLWLRAEAMSEARAGAEIDEGHLGKQVLGRKARHRHVPIIDEGAQDHNTCVEVRVGSVVSACGTAIPGRVLMSNRPSPASCIGEEPQFHFSP